MGAAHRALGGVNPDALQSPSAALAILVGETVVGQDPVVEEEHVSAFEAELDNVFGCPQHLIERVEGCGLPA